MTSTSQDTTQPKQLTEEAMSVELQKLTANTDMTDRQFIRLLEFVTSHSQLAVEGVLGKVQWTKKDTVIVLQQAGINSLIKPIGEYESVLTDEINKQLSALQAQLSLEEGKTD